MNASHTITFSWGELYIYDHRGTAVVNRTNGHMNKDEVAEALRANGYKMTSAGRALRVPHMQTRVYNIAAA